MEKDSVSFWSDIKKYEDMLASDPKSYCFTILAELYRKVGLLDDAINIAKTGILTHPEYVGGYMAAGRAYFEKGMKEESRDCLERVVRVTPENIRAQKILSQIYLEQGDIPSAISTLKVIELWNPEDEESRGMLSNLSKSSVSSKVIPLNKNSANSADELEAADIIAFPGAEEVDHSEDNAVTDDAVVAGSQKDPLSTATMAELYVSQGFLERAVIVYRSLVESGNGNGMYRERLKELEDKLSETAESGTVPSSDSEKKMIESTILSNLQRKALPSGDEGVVAILVFWLDNIKRGRYAAEGDTPKYC